jgi:hypothetical protein
MSAWVHEFADIFSYLAEFDTQIATLHKSNKQTLGSTKARNFLIS